MEHAGNFWTLVGYFNAIRELGGALALYRQDIVERLRKISEGSDTREIDQSRTMELSICIESTRFPSILKELDTLKTPVEQNPDAIFTTSMFGTGVDIPHTFHSWRSRDRPKPRPHIFRQPVVWGANTVLRSSHF